MIDSELRAQQEASVVDVERQLADGRAEVVIFDRVYSRESAWAAAAGLRKAWELNGAYDGVETLPDGSWLARVHVPIGKFPG